MSWVRLDDTFMENPKVQKVGATGIALYVAGLCYCARNLTDGFISAAALSLLGRFSCVSRPLLVSEKLVSTKLWKRTKGGFQVPDYLEYNPSSLQIKGKRARDAKRQRARRRAGLRADVASDSARTSRRSRGGVHGPPTRERATMDFDSGSSDVGLASDVNSDSEVGPNRFAPETETLPRIRDVLEGIGKPGYDPAVLSLPRLSDVLAAYPDRDHFAEAVALADWECYGKGAKLPTKDGIARYRNWLKRAETRSGLKPGHDEWGPIPDKLGPGERIES